MKFVIEWAVLVSPERHQLSLYTDQQNARLQTVWISFCQKVCRTSFLQPDSVTLGKLPPLIESFLIVHKQRIQHNRPSQKGLTLRDQLETSQD